MAGRHGVPSPERRAHARVARRQRRRRVQRRDAAQPWLLWLLVRLVLALIVLGAVGWSALLLSRGDGGYWPIIAIAAGALSLLMIGLDVLARRRQRAALRVQTVARMQEAATPRRRGAHHLDSVPIEPLRIDPVRIDPVPISPVRINPVVEPPPPPRAPEPVPEPAPEPTQGFVPEPPPRPGRHSHRR